MTTRYPLLTHAPAGKLYRVWSLKSLQTGRVEQSASMDRPLLSDMTAEAYLSARNASG